MSNTLPLRYREGISAFAATVLVTKECYAIFKKYAKDEGAVDFESFVLSADYTSPAVQNFMMMLISIFGGSTAIAGLDDKTLFAFPVEETQFAVSLLDDMGDLDDTPVRALHISMRHPIYDMSEDVINPTYLAA